MSGYIRSPPDIEPLDVDARFAFDAARELVGGFVSNPTDSQMGLISIAILAAGIMVANAVHELDATMRRIDAYKDE